MLAQKLEVTMFFVNDWVFMDCYGTLAIQFPFSLCLVLFQICIIHSYSNYHFFSIVTFSRIDPGGKLVIGFRKASYTHEMQVFPSESCHFLST